MHADVGWMILGFTAQPLTPLNRPTGDFTTITV
jgi:hypothetical protein